MENDFCNIWPLRHCDFAQKHTKLVKHGWKFCQILNIHPKMAKRFKILQKWQNFAKSVHTASEQKLTGQRFLFKSQRRLRWAQCDQMTILFLTFYTNENLPKRHTKIVKVSSTECQILNKRSKNCRKLLRFYQSGEISPNLVRLSGPPPPPTKTITKTLKSKSEIGSVDHIIKDRKVQLKSHS